MSYSLDTQIDGVDSLNNILLIGMTNRKVNQCVAAAGATRAVVVLPVVSIRSQDLLEEALLRPGRLEVLLG